jgi:hypothetical protein
MPYFITLANNTVWEITAHTKEENESVGIYEVEQINYKEFDDRFERSNVPSYALINGLPTETWSYTFIPAAKINMQIAVDEYAEVLRTQVATQFAGQYAEYEQAYGEALDISKLDPNAVIINADYPYVAADIGITYSQSLGREVQTIREAADLIISTRIIWHDFGASLRLARLTVKKNIADASTDQAAKLIYDAFVATTIADYLTV